MEFVGQNHNKKSHRNRETVINDRFLFLIDQPLDLPGWIFRTVLLIVLAVLTVRFLLSPIDYEIVGGFWHLVNLPFHEAGHVIFGFLPQLAVSCMGTGLQLLMPMICGFTLMFKTLDTFGAVLCLWWFGENFLDIAPYMADAREGTLPLLGGNTGQDSPYGFHDWEFIFTELKLIQYDTAIASVVWNCGKIIMVVSLLWAGILLVRSFSSRTWKI